MASAPSPKQMKIPLPKLEHRDPVEDPSTSSSASSTVPFPQNADNVQGIYVYQLPFPGTLPEKAQREQLSAIFRKYCKIVDIRFDAVPNNPDTSTTQSAGRRYQLPPLSRRALIVFQKISATSCEGLLYELNKQVMSQCHLKATMAKPEHVKAVIALRNSNNTSGSEKTTLSATANQQSKQTASPAPLTTEQQQQQQTQGPTTMAKRPLNLLKLQLPAPPVKAFAMDAQSHSQPDPFQKNASRTLYVRHLDNNICEEELKTRYGKFGHILDIEVKNRNTLAPYAFIQFTNIDSVFNAIKMCNQQVEESGGGIVRQKKNSGHHWWGNTIVSSRLWIGRLPPNCGEQYLISKMRVVLTQPDDVTQVIYDPNFNEAIIMFLSHESAQIAFNKIKNRNITFQPERSSTSAVEPVHHVHVDFCSEKLHDYFIDRLYGKNTDPLELVLVPPPDPPKCLHAIQPKKSPSPPPDPSTEDNLQHQEPSTSTIKPTMRQRANSTAISLSDRTPPQQQIQEPLLFYTEDKVRTSNSSSAATYKEIDHHSSVVPDKQPPPRVFRESLPKSLTTPSVSATEIAEENIADQSQDHNKEKTTKVEKRQLVELGSGKCTTTTNANSIRHNNRSSSSSSNTSTDTYSQSPRKRWRHPPLSQPSREHTDSSTTRQKFQRKHPKIITATTEKHTWEGKHRSQRSTERRRERHIERGSRRERRRSERPPHSSNRKNVAERSEMSEGGGGRSSSTRDYGGGGKSGTAATVGRKHNRVERLDKYHHNKSRSTEKFHTKERSGSSVPLLPPPPIPPARIDNKKPLSASYHQDQQLLSKQRHHSSSSSACNSSCSCSSCTSGSSSGSHTSSPTDENSDDSEYSSAIEGNNNEPEKAIRSRKNVELADEANIIVESQKTMTIKKESLVHNERLSTPSSSVDTKPLVQQHSIIPKDRERAKSVNLLQKPVVAHSTTNIIAGQRGEEEGTKEVQLHRRDTISGSEVVAAAVHKKQSADCSSVPSQPIKPHQPGFPASGTRPLLRTTVKIPLEATSSSALDPRNIKKDCVAAGPVTLPLPRFALRAKIVSRNEQQQRHAAVHRDSVATPHEDTMPLGTPLSAPMTASVKQEPSFGLEMAIQQKQHEKMEMMDTTTTEAEESKCPSVGTGSQVLDLMDTINKRIKSVENGIADLKMATQPGQIKTSNIEQVEAEMDRIRSDLALGATLEQLELSVAQRSTVMAQLLTTPKVNEAIMKGDVDVDRDRDMKRSDGLEQPGSGRSDHHHHQPERRSSFGVSDASRTSFSMGSGDFHTFVHDTTTAMDNSNRFESPISSRHASMGGKTTSGITSSLSTSRVLTSASSSIAKPTTATAESSIAKKFKSQEQPQTQLRNTSASIPKLKEIKLDRKPSAITSSMPSDPRKISFAHNQLLPSATPIPIKKDQKIDIQRPKGSDESKDKDQHKDPFGSSKLGSAQKKTPTGSSSRIATEAKEEKRKKESEIKHHRDDKNSAKKTSSGNLLKVKSSKDKVSSKVAEHTESASDAEQQRRKQQKHQQRKKRRDESSSSDESSEEEGEGGGVFTDVDIEEQKRMLEAIKSGVGFGMSMYDRVKRRSSQRPGEDEQKKKSALEQIREKQAKKKKEFSRVQLSSASSDSDDDDDDDGKRSTTKEKSVTSTVDKAIHQLKTDALKERQATTATSSEEDVEVDVVDDNENSTILSSIPKVAEQSEKKDDQKQQQQVRRTGPTIRKPDIAPRKPMMDDVERRKRKKREEEEKKEEEGRKTSSSSSSDDEDKTTEEEESDVEDGQMDAGDRAIKKLKKELSRYHKTSESSMDGEDGKDFTQKLARVVAIATEGRPKPASAIPSSATESGELSSSSSSSSSDEKEDEKQQKQPPAKTKEVPKGTIQKGKVKKKVHLSLDDVFGSASSDEDTSDGRRGDFSAPKVDDFEASKKGKIESTMRKDVPKIKIEKKEEPGKDKENEKSKRARVPSMSSVSSIDQQHSKGKKKKMTAEAEQPVANVSNRTKSDSATSKKSVMASKMPISSSSSSSSENEMQETTKHQQQKKKQQTPKQKLVGPKVKEKEVGGVKKDKVKDKEEEERKEEVGKQRKVPQKRPFKTTAMMMEEKEQKAKRTKTALATEKAKGRPTVGEKMKTKEVGTTKKVRAKKQNEKDKEKAMAMDEEDDTIGGLLGIVAQHDASGGEFEVIDSGKVPDDKEKEEEEEEPKKADEKEDEDDDEAIEAELLRRMEERNEEEEAVAALRIQTKTSGVGSRRNSQDLDQPSASVGTADDTANAKLSIVGGEEGWEESAREEEAEVEMKGVVEEEQEEQKQLSKEEEVVAEERKTTAATEQQEQAGDKPINQFRLETIERRASNESVDSHMAGVGNGFVEVDAEHLRQHKREKDALERAAEERRRSEEKAKRMEETVDAVAASSSLLHSQVQEQHDTTVVASLMQQQQHNMLHQVAPSAQQEQQSSLQTGYFQGQQGQAVPIVQQPQQSFTDAQTLQQYTRQEVAVESYPTGSGNFIPCLQQQHVPGSQQQQQQHSVGADVICRSSSTSYLPSQPHLRTPTTQQQQHFQYPQQSHLVQYSNALPPQQQPQSNIIMATTSSVGLPPPSSSVVSSTYTTPTTIEPSIMSKQPQLATVVQQQLQPQHTLQQENVVVSGEKQQQQQQVRQSIYPLQHYQQANAMQQMEKVQQQHQKVTATIHMQQQRKPSVAEVIQQQQYQQPHHSPSIVQPVVSQQQNVQKQTPVVSAISHPSLGQQPQSFVGQMPQQHAAYQMQQSKPLQQQPQIQAVPQQHAQHEKQTLVMAQQPPKQQRRRVATPTTQRSKVAQQQQSQQAQQQQPSVPEANYQQQQSQQQYQQQFQAHQQHSAEALSAMAAAGLMDQQLLSLYQRLRDQQIMQQHAQQQLPSSISSAAALMAAASATNQITPATLAKWHSLVTPTTSAMASQGGPLEELLRHGLIGAQQSPLLAPQQSPASTGGMPTTAATATPASFDELFHHQFPTTSASSRVQHQQLMQQHSQQHHPTIAQPVPHSIQPQMQMHQQIQHPSYPQQQQQQKLPIAGQPMPIQSSSMHQQTVANAQQPQHQQPQTHMMSTPQQQPPQNTTHQMANQQPQNTIAKKQSMANQKYPVLWQGQLAMKNADTLVQMHKVCGNESLIEQMNSELGSVNENGIPLIRVNQRMRLEQTHLEGLIRKMEREENQLALICLPCGRDLEDVAIQTQKMSVSFIEYFSSKSAAGIVSCGPMSQPSSLVAHIFPPSDFSRMLLSRNAPDLLRTVEGLNAGYLFVILTNNK